MITSPDADRHNNEGCNACSQDCPVPRVRRMHRGLPLTSHIDRKARKAKNPFIARLERRDLHLGWWGIFAKGARQIST